MAVTNEQIKGKIIQLLNRKLAEFKEPEEVEVDGEIHNTGKTVEALVLFLTGLTKTKIKNAVKTALQNDKAEAVEKHSAVEAVYDEAITGIDSL